MKIIPSIKNTLIFLIIYCKISNLHSGEYSAKFEHITHEAGLSSNIVSVIFKDSKGFMWFGTHDGLNKYDGYNFKIYKNEPGDSTSIRSNWINAIIEFKDTTKNNSRVFWIGTRNGLIEFDPEKELFINYRNEPGNPKSLSDNNILMILKDTDKDGRDVLWIGTNNGGLNLFDMVTKTFTHYKNEIGNPNSLSNNHIRKIVKERTGVLWVGTSNGLDRFNVEKAKFTHYKNEKGYQNSLSSNIITTIYKDRSGVLWIGTWDYGLNKFDSKLNKGEKEIFKHYKHREGDPKSLSNNHITIIYEDNSGVLWIGTADGLNKFNREEETFIRYKKEIDNNYSLSDDNIVSIFEDEDPDGNGMNILWIGTLKGGINKLYRSKGVFGHWESQPGNANSLSDNHILSICEETDSCGNGKDVFWIGTRSYGLNRFDRKKMSFTHYLYEENNPWSLCSNYILKIYEDSFGVIWIGTTNGLNKFDSKSKTFKRYKYIEGNKNSLSSNFVRTIYEDSSGTLWFGTRNGLNKFDKGNEIFIHYQKEENNSNSLSNNNIRVIYEDRSGTFWIGTDGGLNKFDRETDTFIRYKKEEGNLKSLSYDMVRSVYEDKSGTFWIGTRGGLNKFDRETGQFTHYSERDGLPSDVIFGILEDAYGNIWLSTAGGLSKFNKKTETFRNYDRNDGLKNGGYEVGAYYQSKSGEMFFGGINGVDIFHPDNLKDNTHIPPVVITNFKICGQSFNGDKVISEIKEIELSYKENYFSFEFAALDYVRPSQNQYAYKLENFDSDWIYCGNRRYASYTNLNPINYTFKVKGSNNDGFWNEEGASLKIIIIPPFWKTSWFRIFGFMTIVFLTFAIYQLRTYNIKKRNKQLKEINLKLNQQIKERKKAEKKVKTSLKEKEILLKEIHHRVKNNLQFISSLLNIQSLHIKDKQIQKIFKASQSRIRSMAIVHEKLYMSEDLARIDFAVYIKSLVRSMYVSYGIDPEKIELEVELDDIYLGVDLAVPCGMIVNELVSNALKYAFPHSRKGKIKISIHEVNNDEIELIVYDNGVGIPKYFDFNKIESLGLQLVTILVEDQLQGKIELDRNNGSEFKIKFEMKS